MNTEQTGKLIRDLRTEKNMKQKELADLLHVSAAAVSKWENGHGFPDISILGDLCRILNISIEELMKGERNIMTEEQNTVVNDVIAIAGIQEKKHKRTIRILSVLLGLALLAGILTGMVSIMKNRPAYVEYRPGSLTETNMYIQNNGTLPTLHYKGKSFRRLNDHIIMIPNGNTYEKMYLIISAESDAWNEYFGTDVNEQYSFEIFNDQGARSPAAQYDPERFGGVYLYTGDLRELFSHYPNWTKVSVEALLSHCTYIPYIDELR